MNSIISCQMGELRANGENESSELSAAKFFDTFHLMGITNAL